jgi:Probable zinc-ribbon domain
MKPGMAPWRIETVLLEHKPGFASNLEPGWSARHAKHLIWACDDCLAAGRALEAKPWLQVHGMGFPEFAYFDKPRTCEDCKTEVVFSAAEQLHWFETLHFILYSVPNQCPQCRHKRRQTKALQIELGKAQTQLTGTVPELIQLADLFLELGNTAKALEHLRRAKNKTRSVELRDQLLVRIAALEPGPENTST